MKRLKIKVWFLHLCMKLSLIPKVWYKSELDLAELEAEKLMKVLFKD